MKSDSELNFSLRRFEPIAVKEATLNLDRAFDRGDRTSELDEESVARRIVLETSVASEGFANDEALIIDEFTRKPLIFMSGRAVPHHVGEHQCCEPSRFHLKLNRYRPW
jgi:hypothetical protein